MLLHHLNEVGEKRKLNKIELFERRRPEDKPKYTYMEELAMSLPPGAEDDYSESEH
jgi:hypothetical protein